MEKRSYSVNEAAKYFLKYTGQRGNMRQVADLMKRLPHENLVRMALARGWKGGN